MRVRSVASVQVCSWILCRSDYWADLVSLHTSLGLGLVRGEVAVVAPLTSHKEHELMVISKEVAGPSPEA